MNQILASLLVAVLLFGIAAIGFAVLWAIEYDRRKEATSTNRPTATPGRPDGDPTDRAAAIARAVDDLASCLVAERYGLDAAELERLYARVYVGLSTLTHGQLVSALADALEADAEDRSLVLVNQFRTLPTTRES